MCDQRYDEKATEKGQAFDAVALRSCQALHER